MRSAVSFASPRENCSRQDPVATNRFEQSAALLQAIKDYDNNKWKVIGQKVGKPAKVLLSSSVILKLEMHEILTNHPRLANNLQRSRAGRCESHQVGLEQRYHCALLLFNASASNAYSHGARVSRAKEWRNWLVCECDKGVIVHTCTYGSFTGVNSLSRGLARCMDIDESAFVCNAYHSSLKPYLMLPLACPYIMVKLCMMALMGEMIITARFPPIHWLAAQ